MTINQERIEAYVVRCDGEFIEIKFLSNELRYQFTKNGYTEDIKGGNLVKSLPGDIEKAKEMEEIRNLGIPFSYGQGWSPSAVFEYFREVNLVSGSYKEIHWVGVGNFKVTTR